MQKLYRNDRFEADEWTHVGDDDALPAAGAVFLGKARWFAERACLSPPPTGLSIGLALKVGEEIDDIIGDLSRFSAIALDFPKFADGRSYSTARLLRESHGYRGELRAVGDVLIDQIALMKRCGFDAFVISHEPTSLRLEKGEIPNVPLYTQPISEIREVPTGTRPWLRVPAAG